MSPCSLKRCSTGQPQQRVWIKAKPICPSKSCYITRDRTLLVCGNVVLSCQNTLSRVRLFPTKQRRHSASVSSPITQNCFDITSHKVKRRPFRERIGRKRLKLCCVWGMLIYLETESGDVLIKDSISQRSVGCNHTLPLTDGVFRTSARWRLACHKH